MGKRIIQQRRGRGSMRYRARKQGYKYKIGYPPGQGSARVLKLINSAAHSYPLAKIIMNKEIFFNPAFNGMIEGQDIKIGGEEIKQGNILFLKDIATGVEIYNIEARPGDGGKIIRSGGNSAFVTKKEGGKVGVLLPSKREIWFDERCRATIGKIAGQGRLDKPFVKAGKKFYLMQSKGKLWPRTSAVKMNVIDHPFGSGRGKNLSHGTKGKIPKRNAPPGAKVGNLRPSRSGRRKR